jgi:hypothetical protein
VEGLAERERAQRLPELRDLQDRLTRYETTLNQLAATVEQNRQQIQEAKNQLQVIAQHEGVDLGAPH